MKKRMIACIIGLCSLSQFSFAQVDAEKLPNDLIMHAEDPRTMMNASHLHLILYSQFNAILPGAGAGVQYLPNSNYGLQLDAEGSSVWFTIYTDSPMTLFLGQTTASVLFLGKHPNNYFSIGAGYAGIYAFDKYSSEKIFGPVVPIAFNHVKDNKLFWKVGMNCYFLNNDELLPKVLWLPFIQSGIRF